MSRGVACSLIHNSSQLPLKKVAFMWKYCSWTGSSGEAQPPKNPYCSVYNVKEYHGCYQLFRVPEKCFLACHHFISKSGYEAHKGTFHSPRAQAPASCPSGMGGSSLEMSKKIPPTMTLNNRNMFSYSPGS